MILPNFKNFPKKGRILGIDWGAMRTGIAVSDEKQKMVFVRDVMVGKNNIDKIIKITTSDNIAGIVIGLPLRLDGSDSDTTGMVRDFAGSLSNKVNIPIVFIDETLTSLCAQADMGRISKVDIKQKLDSESARVILENAISMINRT